MGNDMIQVGDDFTHDILRLLDKRLTLVEVVGRNIILRVTEPMDVATRGHLLLETEKSIRQRVHPELEVFLEYKEDKNYMRLLRGVEGTE